MTPKTVPSCGGTRPPPNTWLFRLVPTSPHPQTTSHSVQPFLQRSQSWQTDRPRYSRTRGRILFFYLFNTHTHPFNGPLSGTTRVSRYQKGKTNLDSTEARHSEWQWHPLGHMYVCTLLQTDNHASNQLLRFTGRMPFLPPNQQHQSTEGIIYPLANTDNKNTVRTSDCRTTRQNKCTYSRSSQAGTK